MRPSAVVAMLCVGSAFAGCLSGDEPLSPGLAAEEDLVLPRDLAGLPDLGGNITDAPAWAVGDSWSIITSDGQTGALVVVSAASSAYTMGTDNLALAWWDAIFDISYLGAIRAHDLSGSQWGTPVKFYDFPLQDGKKWTTMWDDVEVELTATAGASGVFQIVGTAGGAPFVSYDFSPALKWWSHMDFDGYGVKVTGFKSNWTGDYVLANAKELLSLGTGRPPAGSFKVDEGQTTVILTTISASEQMVRARAIVDPSGQPYMSPDGSDVTVSLQPMEEWATQELPPTPGEWRIAVPTVLGAVGTWSLTVHQVATTTATLSLPQG